MYCNTLIKVASDCTVKRGTIPESNRKAFTDATVYYEVLSQNRYKLTEREFYKESLEIRLRKKVKHKKYMMKRNILCKKWGWGVHFDCNGKMALVGCETNEYNKLLSDPAITKMAAYRSTKQLVE
jgi:hypothetical protein